MKAQSHAVLQLLWCFLGIQNFCHDMTWYDANAVYHQLHILLTSIWIMSFQMENNSPHRKLFLICTFLAPAPNKAQATGGVKWTAHGISPWNIFVLKQLHTPSAERGTRWISRELLNLKQGFRVKPHKENTRKTVALQCLLTSQSRFLKNTTWASFILNLLIQLPQKRYK